MKHFSLTIFVALSLSVVAISGTDESNELANSFSTVITYEHENCYTKTDKKWYLSRTLESWAKASQVCQSNKMQLASFDTKEEKDQFISFQMSQNKIENWVGDSDEVQSANGIKANCPLLKIANKNHQVIDAPCTQEHFFICESVVKTNILEDKNKELVALQNSFAKAEINLKSEIHLIKSEHNLLVKEHNKLQKLLKKGQEKLPNSTQTRYDEYEIIIDDYKKTIHELTKQVETLIVNNTSAMFCNYDFINKVYSCNAEGLEIPKENVDIVVSGNHLPGKQDEDVFELNISNSNTKFLSNSIFHYFEKLRNIKIVKSHLQSLSKGVFSGAEYLRKVFIEGNNIKFINPNTFEGADNLNILNLGNNQIEFVAPGAFDGLKFLTTLNLNNNKLKEIPTSTLNTLHNLMYLKLAANEFDKLDGALLKNNTILREVWFDRNNIYNIGSDLLSYSDKYQRTVFSDNVCIDNDSENTDIETVQNDIIEKCTALHQNKENLNTKIWAKCPKNDTIQKNDVIVQENDVIPQEKVPEIQEKVPEVQEKVPEIQDVIVQENGGIPQEKVPEVEEKVPEVEEKVPEVEEKVPKVEEKVPKVEEKVPKVEEKVPEVEDVIVQDNVTSKQEVQEVDDFDVEIEDKDNTRQEKVRYVQNEVDEGNDDFDPINDEEDGQ